MFHRARRKLAELIHGEVEEVIMIGDTMETDIRGAVEAGINSFLVLTGSTDLNAVSNYVYPPTRILQSVADLTEEIKTGKPSNRLDSPAFTRKESDRNRIGPQHQTDFQHITAPRPRPAMTR
jgi:NagD protein